MKPGPPATLTRLGYKIIERNVRFREGELDIVAWDGETLVFVEVKCRSGGRFGPPQASITPQRFQHLSSAIDRYLADRELEPENYRVDVVALEVDTGGSVARHSLLRGVEAPPGWS